MDRVCNKCHIEKPLTQFYKDKTRKGGHRYECIDCNNSSRSKYATTNRDRENKASKLRRTKALEWVREYKVVRGCLHCGENHPAVLDFHHLDPTVKDASIAVLTTRNVAKSDLETEIAKCIVLCSNCHRKLHWDERRA